MNMVSDKLDIIVLAGQSNAQGQGQGETEKEYVPNERVLMMTDDADPKFVTENGTVRLVMKQPAINQVAVAEERTEQGKKIGCLALSFAEHYVKECLAEDRKLLIIQANHGGTGFARPEWGVGNVMHTRMIHMTKEALSYHPENRVVALLWHQGEHDAFENAHWDPEKRYCVHKANLSATLDDFYAQIGDSAIPFIAGGFCDEWYLENKVACDAVLSAIKACVAQVGGGFVETSGLLSNKQKVGNADDIHFCRESLRILGERYFAQYAMLAKRKENNCWK